MSSIMDRTRPWEENENPRDIIGNAKRHQERMYGDMIRGMKAMNTERRITKENDPISVKYSPDKDNSYFYGISFKEWEEATGIERDWTEMGTEDLKIFFRMVVDKLKEVK